MVHSTYGLIEAAKGDHVETMRYLLHHGATIQATTISKTRSSAGFQVLIDHGFSVNEDLHSEVPLISIIPKGDKELLLWFLSQGADSNFGPPDGISLWSKEPLVNNSGIALQVATQCSITEIVDIFLGHGAKMENSLPLHGALLRGPRYRFTMMEHLIQRGADVNNLGYAHTILYKGTPLHVAAKYGDITDVQWLIDHGADINIPDGLEDS